MGQLLLFIVVALTVAAIVFGVTVMMSGGDSGLAPVEPDGRALPLPGDRPLGEEDVVRARFDTAVRGYRMSQVDQALQRAAYDIGYKGELISVLEAEVTALREGRTADADVLRRAREAAAQPIVEAPAEPPPAPFPTEAPVVASPAPASQGPASQGPASQAPASGSTGAGGPVYPADPDPVAVTSSPESGASVSPVGQPAADDAERVEPQRVEPEQVGSQQVGSQQVGGSERAERR